MIDLPLVWSGLEGGAASLGGRLSFQGAYNDSSKLCATRGYDFCSNGCAATDARHFRLASRRRSWLGHVLNAVLAELGRERRLCLAGLAGLYRLTGHHHRLVNAWAGLFRMSVVGPSRRVTRPSQLSG